MWMVDDMLDSTTVSDLESIAVDEISEWKWNVWNNLNIKLD